MTRRASPENDSPEAGDRWSARDLLALGLIVAGPAAVGQLAFHPALMDRLAPEHAFWCTAAVHLLATVGFLWLVWRVRLGVLRPGVVPIVTVGLAMHALCLGTHAPTLSDDVYRYIHEGRMVLMGHNPYAIAPIDVPMALRGPEWGQINNPEIAAAYPPAMQYALAVGVWIDPSPLGMRIVFGGLDVLAGLLLWLVLRGAGRNPALAIVYAWCPLTAVEFAGQAHGDSLAVAFTLLGIWLGQRGGTGLVLAGSAMGIATGAKLLPIVLLPFVLGAVGRNGPGRERPGRSWHGYVGFAATLVGLYAPLWTEGLLRGTTEYVGRWRSNDSLFGLVHAATEWFLNWSPPDADASVWLREPQRLAKIPLAVAGLVVLGVGWWRGLGPLRMGLWFFTFFVVAAPTLHPWYLALWLPFLVLRPSLLCLGFTGTVLLAYHVLPGWFAHQEWVESPAWKAIEYAPLYLGLLLGGGSRPPEGAAVGAA